MENKELNQQSPVEDREVWVEISAEAKALGKGWALKKGWIKSPDGWLKKVKLSSLIPQSPAPSQERKEPTGNEGGGE